MSPSPPRSRRLPVLQYMLLAIVAALGLTHMFVGGRQTFRNLTVGTRLADIPFYTYGLGGVIRPSPAQCRAAGVPAGSTLLTLTHVADAAKAAGLKVGDAIYTIDGRPFLGTSVLLQETANHHPGQTMDLTVWRAASPPDAPPVHLSLPLSPQRASPPRPWIWFLQAFFTLLPAVCLVTGLYVVFALPRDANAWLILGILAWFTSMFVRPDLHEAALLPLTASWVTLAQAAMPPCFMLFGIYFPDRSRIDIRHPWIKWLILAPSFAVFPVDHLYDYGYNYRFGMLAPFQSSLRELTTFENVLAALAIAYAFFCLFSKVNDPAARPDARRRLRILVAGSSIGLLPLLVLVVISTSRGLDLGEAVPRWVALSIFFILFSFPLTLAYVVVVQRAMDLRILIRQGTKYFFARQSIVIVRVLLITWMSYTISIFSSIPTRRRYVDAVQMLAVIVLAIAYRSVAAKRLQGWVDRRFFREAYSTEQLLSEISDEARNFTETGPLLETITRRLGSTLHIERIAVFLRSGDLFQLQYATGAAVLPGHLLSLPASSTTIANLSRGKAAPAEVYRDDPDSWLLDATDAERNALADLSTELLVPLPGRNRLVGVIALGPKASEEPYTRTDRQLLQSLASQTGLALENAELLASLTVELAQRASIQREIEIAREVQERLFPQTIPDLPGIGLAGFCRPAQFVGGDYYDFFLIPQPATPAGPAASRLAIAIGDISGKGISAALLMASLRASLRSVATIQQPEADPAKHLATLIQHVNRLVYEASTANRYATFFYAELDPATRLLTYVNAGHNCPAILRPRPGVPAEIIQLQPTGTVVGLLPDASYEQASIQLQPGDTLLAFTDGISEAMTAEDEEWGEDRMLAAAQHLIDEPACTRTAHQLQVCLLEQADAFTAGAPQHDDMTLLLCTIA